jgi:hypothetical protein
MPRVENKCGDRQSAGGLTSQRVTPFFRSDDCALAEHQDVRCLHTAGEHELKYRA